MNKSESIKNLAKALVEIAKEMNAVSADSTNPYFKSKYTSFDSLVAALKPVAAKHGVTWSQLPTNEVDRVGVETLIMHVSGEWIEKPFTLPLTKQDPQAGGSCITYSKRYALASAFGIATDHDDDAETHRKPEKKNEVKPAAKPVVATVKPTAAKPVTGATKESKPVKATTTKTTKPKGKKPSGLTYKATDKQKSELVEICGARGVTEEKYGDKYKGILTEISEEVKGKPMASLPDHVNKYLDKVL